MRAHCFPSHRLLACTLALSCLAAVSWGPKHAAAAQADTFLELRPHCEEKDLENLFGGAVPDNPFMTTPTEGACTSFEVKDPETRQTSILAEGDTLDMDLVIRNPGGHIIKRVRAWLAYDPTLLEGESVDIDSAFTQPLPDEQTFSPQEGYVKVGASTDVPLNASTIRIAHIRMRVMDATAAQTVISFYDASEGASERTVVVTEQAGVEQGLLRLPLGSLLVRFAAQASSQPLPRQSSANSSAQYYSAAAVNPVASSNNSAPSSMSASSLAQGVSSTSGVFALLQVQHLRATTEGTALYLAWDKLTSAEIVGYNVYYGTISGEYIQRRSIDKASTTLALRSLTPDARYYVAIRGMSSSGQETDFSQEVAVTVGRPETSTSPLAASVHNPGPQGTPPKTDGTLAGETGIPFAILLAVLASAAIGTVLALRRQFIALGHPRV